jgi:AsmA protein
MRALKWIGIAVLALIVLLALFIAFGLNTLRGPVSRAVTQATGRELVIEGNLEPVWSWVHPRIRAERVRFANAQWAQEEQFFTADAVEASISVLPLLRGRVVLPEVHLEKPMLALEQDEEGRKNWILEKDPEKKEESRIHVQRLTLDQGHVRYDDAMRDISLESDLSSDQAGVTFAVSGNYQGNDLVAVGHTGPVLSIRDESSPFPVQAQIEAGATRAQLDGSITGLVGLKGIDMNVRLAGDSLEELYWIVNVAFPATPPYSTAGRLVREGDVIRYENFNGKIGESDIAGTLEVDLGPERPFMRGNLHAKTLNLADLGMVVGADQPREKGVLPDAPFSPERWDSVDADVSLKAGTIKRPKQLPIEQLSTRIQMKDRVLTLNPLEFGIAGGKLAGPVRLDGTRDTIRADVRMRVQDLKFARLFPTLKENRASAGDLNGLIELTGTGNSVGRMLGTANGKIGVFMDGGEVSAFLMNLVALDLWGVAKTKLQGDKNIAVNCAIADFKVEKGLMQTNAFVFDTEAVKIEGGGVVNLMREEMDLKLDPKPKETSIASLNSPLYVRGTFSDPKVSPEWGKVAAKSAGAIVMGIVSPILSVLPLFKEGKGEDSNCGQLIAEATKSTRQAAKSPQGSAAAGATKR